MKTIYIHIGLHKTGTTTIQDYLIDNIEGLKAHGVFVPFPHRNHNLTLWENGKGKRHKQEPNWERFMRRMDKTDVPVVVISSEFFSRDISEIEDWHVNFSKLVQLGHKLKFILYLRRSDKRFESLFIEAIKGGVGLRDIRNFPYTRFIDNWQLCEAIIERFGKESLIVRKFEIDAKQGLIKSFLGCLGLPEIEVDELKYQTNTKPNLDQLRAIQYAGELYSKITTPLFSTARYKRKAIKRWGRWFMDQTMEWQDQSAYTLLPDDIAKMILDDQFESNKKIADAFFDGDMTHLHAENLPVTAGESLSIINMKKEHLEQALELFIQVEKIIEAIETEPPTSKRGPQNDEQDT